MKRWSFGLVIFSNSNQEKMVKKKLVCEEGDNECSNKKKLSSCSSTPHFPCHPRPVHPSFLKIMIGDFQDFLVCFFKPKLIFSDAWFVCFICSSVYSIVSCLCSSYPQTLPKLWLI